jgi:tetratricopeptide (TPR) repeat protein
MVYASGDPGKGKQLHQQSLAIQQSLGDRREAALSLAVLGAIAMFTGQVDEGERLIRESVAVLREMGDRPLIARCLQYLGEALHKAVGKYTQAHSVLDECLAIRSDLGLRSIYLAFPIMERSGAKVQLGRYEQARAQAKISLALSREVDYRWGIGGSLVILSSVALAEEAYTEAQALLQESVATYRTIGQWAELSWALAHLGYVARGLGQLAQARQYLSEALRMATGTGEYWPPVYVLPALALLLVDQGEVERAVELYALASRYPLVANSRWFEDIAGRHIAAAAQLPPDVVAAAQERGRARDLWATVEELLAELEES